MKTGGRNTGEGGSAQILCAPDPATAGTGGAMGPPTQATADSTGFDLKCGDNGPGRSAFLFKGRTMSHICT